MENLLHLISNFFLYQKSQTKEGLVLKIWRGGAKLDDPYPTQSKSSDQTIEEIKVIII